MESRKTPFEFISCSPQFCADSEFQELIIRATSPQKPILLLLGTLIGQSERACIEDRTIGRDSGGILNSIDSGEPIELGT